MTTEAISDLNMVELSPQCIIEGSRTQIFLSNRNLQPVNDRIVTDAAFVISPVALEDPGLHVLTYRPAEQHGNSTSAIAHGVRGLPSTGLNAVSVVAIPENQIRVRLQRGIAAGQQKRARHRRLRLMDRFSPMTVSARRSGNRGLLRLQSRLDHGDR